MSDRNTAMVDRIEKFGLVPVIKLEEASQAVPLADALCRGGLPVAEVTFRTSAAAESIRRIRAAHPEMCVGAGTVLSEEQARKALDAGAEFMVSPGFNRPVVEFCLAEGVPVVPGCSGPTDMEMALGYGLSAVKFFPAEASGGIVALKAMAAPYGSLRFMPTGGVDAKNLKDYLAFDRVFACGGSWMVKEDLLAAGDFASVERLAAEAVAEVLGFEIAHVGVNMPDEPSASDAAGRFAALLGMPGKAGNSSIFVGTLVEVMKSKGRGDMGHLAIRTRSIARAVDWLARQGFERDTASESRDAKGKVRTVYLKESIGGFAVHLVQK
jgi:2-dehydro-3-deoxyphosphogluconate aldolase/(4S)-4-hydroxy-2-oxoglutarate aldolase